MKRQHKESDAIQLLKIREGDIAHPLPVNPKLNGFGSMKSPPESQSLNFFGKIGGAARI
jgi:hypothetical protein